MGYTWTDFKNTLQLFLKSGCLQSRKTYYRLSAALVLVLLDILSASFLPYCSKQVIDNLPTPSNVLWVFTSLIGVFWILEKTLSHLQEIIFFPIVNKTIRNITYNSVEHLHNISLSHFQQLSLPETLNSIRRISQSARMFIKILLLTFIPSCIKLIIAAIIVFKTGLLGFILSLTIFIVLFTLVKGTLWYSKIRDRAWNMSDQAMTQIHDSLLNTKLCRFFKVYELTRVGDTLNLEADLWQKTNTRLHTIYVAIGLILGICLTLTLFGTLLAIRKGALTPGDFVFIQGQLMAAFLPFRAFSMEFRQITDALIDTKKIIALLNIPLEKRTQPSYTPVNHGIALQSVSFAQHHRVILKEMNCTIGLGEKIGIIGKSGSGKTTLLQLMSGLLLPSTGQITVLGLDTRTQISPHIHYIPQETHLFNATLRANLTYGLSHCTDLDCIKVLETVDLQYLLKELPHHLDSIVGEMGTKLSGGERQKLAIARALLLKPTILLLDEATNALNTQAEKAVLDCICQSISTVVMTSHRKSALTHVNRLYLIEQGYLIDLTTTPTVSIL